MSLYETYLVCKECFTSTLFKDNPTLERLKDRNDICMTCTNEWNGITVGYYTPETKWYEVRRRPVNSENVLCQNKMKGKCSRESLCRRAHNKLELYIWTNERTDRKNPIHIPIPKFRCIICYDEFEDNESLITHIQSPSHEARADALFILPKVGSSLEYTGPIRQRPKLADHKQAYELCPMYAQNARCQYSTGCKHPHSEEELKVWTEALAAEENHSSQRQRHNFEEASSGSGQEKSEFHFSSAGATKSEPRIQSESDGRKKRTKGKDPEYIDVVLRSIKWSGIKSILTRRLKHIELICDRNLTLTVNEDKKSTEITWIFKLKSTQCDHLISIILHEHQSMFRLGELFKCSVKGTGKNQPRYECTLDKTSYLVDQELNKHVCMEVALIGKPQIGRYSVYIVFHLNPNVLIGREVTVKIRGEEFRKVTDEFLSRNRPQPKSAPTFDDLLKVNWESCFELANCKFDSQKHPMPIYIEEKLAKGGYDNMRDSILQKDYTLRFNTLLFIEEFEHKKSLMKYDLPNETITFKTVKKQIFIEREFGKNISLTAPENAYFVTFKLKHQLFEGYRSFRPPKLAYIIPHMTRKAFTCTRQDLGTDYITFIIGNEAVTACERNGGLVMVRFSPDRDDYVNMHEAVETTNYSVLFPEHRRIRLPHYWREDHLLYMLDRERLSDAQKYAIDNIADSYYQSLPTIICGPFGCGKTKTLSVAAMLIALTYSGSRILIATKTNSCANIYIELLGSYFDTITMARGRQGERKILFRHFGKSRNISWDRQVNKFANIKENAYYGLPVYELEWCSIVVTTTQSAATLLPPKARGHRKDLFTHIFIDEAAQIIEPEACIPLSLAGDYTKIVLAGDIHQSRPVILSKTSLKYNLDKSLLERFEALPRFKTDALSQCQVHLVENFRSRESIVYFLSELFYDKILIANPPFLAGPLDFPALSFLHVSGEEQRLHGFPSFFNEEEVDLTIKALRKFVSCGVPVGKVAILTTFKAQEALLRECLRQETSKCRMQGHFLYSQSEFCKENNCINSRTIEVKNLEGIQGREYDLVIVNTVRTIKGLNEDKISMEEKLDLGMLDDVTQFNTVLTRARGWVMVIGKADCLTTVGGCSQVWTKYIDRCRKLGSYFVTVEEMNAK